MTLQTACCSLGPYLALALLACCTDMPGAPQGPTVAATVNKPLRNNGIRSWMAADAKTKDLLYVTNGPVDVYSYPQGELVGQLTGFSLAYGTCTGKKGNVYITDYKENAVVEYAHGGAQPIRTLSVPGTGPVACAVDPGSGDLAVTNAGQYGTAAGANVAIYRKAKGTPKTYTFRRILSYFYCTYDNAGNLYADGIPARGYGYDTELAELPRGAKSFKPVNVEYGMPWKGGLQWDGQYLVVGEPIRPHILRYTMIDRYGVYAGSTTLTDAYNAFQFILAGKKAIVTNEYYYDRYIARWDVLVFDYPAGGEDTQQIIDSDVQIYSVALSRGHK